MKKFLTNVGTVVLIIFAIVQFLIWWSDMSKLDDTCLVQVTELESGNHIYIAAAGIPAEEFCASFSSGEVAGFWVTPLGDGRFPDLPVWCGDSWYDEQGELIGEWRLMSNDEYLGLLMCVFLTER